MSFEGFPTPNYVSLANVTFVVWHIFFFSFLLFLFISRRIFNYLSVRSVQSKWITIPQYIAQILASMWLVFDIWAIKQMQNYSLYAFSFAVWKNSENNYWIIVIVAAQWYFDIGKTSKRYSFFCFLFRSMVCVCVCVFGHKANWNFTSYFTSSLNDGSTVTLIRTQHHDFECTALLCCCCCCCVSGATFSTDKYARVHGWASTQWLNAIGFWVILIH